MKSGEAPSGGLKSRMEVSKNVQSCKHTVKTSTEVDSGKC
jgi:hypothetical protein